MTWVENLILSVIEGITEYLPVSSTGHMMMVADVMQIDLSKIDTYIISVQFGAILAVIALYRKKFFEFKSWNFYLKLIFGFIPAAILGLLFDDFLESLLQTSVIVGFTLVIVGAFLLFMDKVLPGGNKTVDSMSYKDAFIIGVVQSVAMIPGVSRSAATIAGALGCKLNKIDATEFSFFLAVPTLTAAGGYKVLKNWDLLSQNQLNEIVLGNVLSFITALAAIKFFIALVKNRGFALFGVYRILVGAAFLVYLYLK